MHQQRQNQPVPFSQRDLGSHVQSDSPPRPQWSRDDWYDCLSRPGRQLIELHALTEDRFLNFGAFLRDFHTRATSVSSLALIIRDQMVGDEASGGISSLQLLVERMSLFLQDIRTSSEQNEQALTSICTTLERLHQPLQAFQRITKTLQVVGITTRVECSGFADSQNNVTNLSDSIRRLGALIAGNMNEIIDQVAILHKLSREALRNESALNNGQSTTAMAVVDQARGVLAQLVENRNSALEKSESLTITSKAVEHSIAEIVSSIQFHDITRQQIEHVTETLDAFKDAIADSFQAGLSSTHSVLESEIAQGCRLQADQLQNANNELSAAVWRIVESLHSLAASVTAVANDTRQLGGDTERDGTTFFDAIEPAIESVTAVLNENLVTASQSAMAVAEVVNAAETMVLLVDEIERFGAEMKVMALNASIESVHVKAGGSSLSVIADSIQELAREALVQTDELATGLTEITEGAKTLKDVNPEDGVAQGSTVSALSEDAELLLGELRQANNKLLESFGQMDQQAEILARDIAVAASSINVHTESAAIIAKGVEALNFISEQFSVGTGSVMRSDSSSLFKEMMNRYSMKSERDIHNQNSNDRQLKRVFEKQTEEHAASGHGDHGLGANVELF